MISRLMIAAAVTAGVGAAPLSAEAILNVQKSGPQERVTGPAANGDAKRYFSQVEGTCVASICTVAFGKKSGKVRTIETLSCALIGSGPNLVAGVNVAADPQEIEYWLPPASNVEGGGSFYSVFERTKAFAVPEGVPFNVLGQSSGNGGTFICTAVGTIK